MNRTEINNSNMINARVCGVYCGAVANGTITHARPMYGTDMQYTVKLDENIFPFQNKADPRDTLLLSGEDLEQGFDVVRQS